MKDIPKEAKVAVIVAAVPLLLAILSIVFKAPVLFFITGIAIVILFLFVHLYIGLIPYLQTPKEKRDDEWRRGMNALRICHLMYIAAIILLIVGWKILIR